jgi:hypothetical protein
MQILRQQSTRRAFSAEFIMRINLHRLALTSIAVLGMLCAPRPVSADPAQDASAPGKVAPLPERYGVINHIGDVQQQVSLDEGKLLAHRRSTDSFGVAIRGKFKGLPAVAEHPAATSSQQPVQAPVVANGPTLEQAIEQLPVGGVNIASREVLIGSRSVHEGDLLILELSGQQFVVWVQSIDRRGVQFCDVTLQRHKVKPFRFGPDELPTDFAGAQSDVRNFLNQDAHYYKQTR